MGRDGVDRSQRRTVGIKVNSRMQQAVFSVAKSVVPPSGSSLCVHPHWGLLWDRVSILNPGHCLEFLLLYGVIYYHFYYFLFIIYYYDLKAAKILVAISFFKNFYGL